MTQLLESWKKPTNLKSTLFGLLHRIGQQPDQTSSRQKTYSDLSQSYPNCNLPILGTWSLQGTSNPERSSSWMSLSQSGPMRPTGSSAPLASARSAVNYNVQWSVANARLAALVPDVCSEVPTHLPEWHSLTGDLFGRCKKEATRYSTLLQSWGHFVYPSLNNGIKQYQDVRPLENSWYCWHLFVCQRWVKASGQCRILTWLVVALWWCPFQEVHVVHLLTEQPKPELT